MQNSFTLLLNKNRLSCYIVMYVYLITVYQNTYLVLIILLNVSVKLIYTMDVFFSSNYILDYKHGNLKDYITSQIYRSKLNTFVVGWAHSPNRIHKFY